MNSPHYPSLEFSEVNLDSMLHVLEVFRSQCARPWSFRRQCRLHTVPSMEFSDVNLDSIMPILGVMNSPLVEGFVQTISQVFTYILSYYLRIDMAQKKRSLSMISPEGKVNTYSS
jgi:hypothetical protein